MNEGLIIKFLREEMKLTQNDLANDICTVRYLRKIENGLSNPSYDMIHMFSERLGSDLNIMMNEDVIRYGFELFSKLREIEHLFNSWNYRELEQEVNILLDSHKFVLSEFHNKKLLLYKAICLKENHNKYIESKSILLNIINCENLTELTTMLKKYCSDIDLKVCNAIAANEYLSGNILISHNIYVSILNNITARKIINFDNLIKVYYNLAKISYDLEKYTKSIEYALNGIDICKERCTSYLMADTYLYLAKSSEKMEDDKNHKLYYKKFIYLYTLFGNHAKVKKQIDIVINENNLDIDIDILTGEL